MGQFGNLDTEVLSKEVVASVGHYCDNQIQIETFKWPKAPQEHSTILLFRIKTIGGLRIIQKKTELVGYNMNKCRMINHGDGHAIFFGKRREKLFHISLFNMSDNNHPFNSKSILNGYSSATNLIMAYLRGYNTYYYFNKAANEYLQSSDNSRSGSERIRVMSERHLKMHLKSLNDTLEKNKTK